ncbi:MAG TPA: undecaprenyl-diphosphate phosphatase [Aggregatilinea sp.]|uniref:undecaprenyl-diphosphate phosphatase n=1 Tax=Aggregatilinea sp. TaxID=2806333 RepID=UPI002B986BCD|nr:undecaprenyl-diphosphate phosphatase [Aggregatilinea sp.]HML21507.1 undecaprenyl-diphosphate phosphatase [Aggregatilinea sp.]
MDLLRAVILGIAQGATDFLPISSSGHLVLVPWWLGWSESSLVFDTILRLGTLMAVLVYFWRDWPTHLRAAWTALRTRSVQDPDARLLLYFMLGAIPAALAGLLLEDHLNPVFGAPWTVTVLLTVAAVVLAASERARQTGQTSSGITAPDALVVGVAQPCANLPGLSRLGSTIAAGMGRGLSRPDPVRLSLWLAVPILCGAGFIQGLDILLGNLIISHDTVTPVIAALVAALIGGHLCIRFLLHLVQQQRLYGFAPGTQSLLVALLT